jgi:hypothetical protein
MKRIVHPANPPGSEPKQPEVKLPPISEISISSLLDDGLLTLFREMKNLKSASVNGKLSANDAKDLRDHLKLLFELKDREEQLLRGLTDEDLEKQARKALNDNE